MFRQKTKHLHHFADPTDRTQCLFKPEDLKKTLIVDDQYPVVYDKSSLILSKKFMKFADLVDLGMADPETKLNWNKYYYPDPSYGSMTINDI